MNFKDFEGSNAYSYLVGTAEALGINLLFKEKPFHRRRTSSAIRPEITYEFNFRDLGYKAKLNKLLNKYKY